MLMVDRRQCPEDFTEKFPELGRLQCEEHYCAGRNTVTRWLEECGKAELIAKRKAHVRDKRRAGITRREMQQILAHAFPVPSSKFVNPRLAQAAARYLQVHRNGGWVITRAPHGMWRVGMVVRTAAEMVEMARAAGFQSTKGERA
jgi:hypothetical protein